jgi:hypothetical protein
MEIILISATLNKFLENFRGSNLRQTFFMDSRLRE